MATNYAAPYVSNLDQVRIGDQVDVSYYEALGVAMAPAGTAGANVDQEVAVVRSAAGGRPAGAIGETLTATVEIESVDTAFNTVTFKRADGLARLIAVEEI